MNKISLILIIERATYNRYHIYCSWRMSSLTIPTTFTLNFFNAKASKNKMSPQPVNSAKNMHFSCNVKNKYDHVRKQILMKDKRFSIAQKHSQQFPNQVGELINQSRLIIPELNADFISKSGIDNPQKRSSFMYNRHRKSLASEYKNPSSTYKCFPKRSSTIRVSPQKSLQFHTVNADKLQSRRKLSFCNQIIFSRSILVHVHDCQPPKTYHQRARSGIIRQEQAKIHRFQSIPGKNNTDYQKNYDFSPWEKQKEQNFEMQ